MAVFGKADAKLPLLTWAVQVDIESEQELLRLCTRVPGLRELLDQEYHRHQIGEYTPKKLTTSRDPASTDFWQQAFPRSTVITGPHAAGIYPMPATFNYLSLMDEEELAAAQEVVRERNREWKVETVIVTRFDAFLLELRNFLRPLQSMMNALASERRLSAVDWQWLQEGFVWYGYDDTFALPLIAQAGQSLFSDPTRGSISFEDLEQAYYRLKNSPPEVPEEDLFEEEGIRKLQQGIFTGAWNLIVDLTKGEAWRLKRCGECDCPFVASDRRQQYCSHRCADRRAARKRRGSVARPRRKS